MLFGVFWGGEAGFVFGGLFLKGERVVRVFNDCVLRCWVTCFNLKSGFFD